MTTDEVSKRLRLARREVCSLFRQREIQGTKVSGCWWSTEEAIVTYLARRHPEWWEGKVTPECLRRIAYHEAGHAVAAFVLNQPFTRVTVIPQETFLGCVYFGEPDPHLEVKRLALLDYIIQLFHLHPDEPRTASICGDAAEFMRLTCAYLETLGVEPEDPEQQRTLTLDDTEHLLQRAIIDAAGGLADLYYSGAFDEAGTRYDRASIVLMGLAVGFLERDVDAVLDYFGKFHEAVFARSWKLVCEHSAGITALAWELLHQGELDGDDARQVIESTLDRVVERRAAK